MSNAVTKHEAIEVEAPRGAQVVSMMDMIAQAAATGNLEMVERLMDLQDRHEGKKAHKAFDAAMAAARAEMPVITKNRQVGYDNKGGGQTSYRHEDLGEIARAVDPVLAKHGLSYRWRTETPVNGPVIVTCIISHADGHSEENTLSAGRDDSGKKNSIQSIGSTITYLQRYTLKAALGLAASADDDAKSSEDVSDDLISDEQVLQLRDLIEAVGADEKRFLQFGGLDRLEDMKAAHFKDAVAKLNAKRAK